MTWEDWAYSAGPGTKPFALSIWRLRDDLRASVNHLQAEVTDLQFENLELEREIEGLKAKLKGGAK
jgi:hypothetical protein